jgi:hypothetical protein
VNDIGSICKEQEKLDYGYRKSKFHGPVRKFKRTPVGYDMISEGELRQSDMSKKTSTGAQPYEDKRTKREKRREQGSKLNGRTLTVIAGWSTSNEDTDTCW